MTRVETINCDKCGELCDDTALEGFGLDVCDSCIQEWISEWGGQSEEEAIEVAKKTQEKPKKKPKKKTAKKPVKKKTTRESSIIITDTSSEEMTLAIKQKKEDDEHDAKIDWQARERILDDTKEEAKINRDSSRKTTKGGLLPARLLTAAEKRNMLPDPNAKVRAAEARELLWEQGGDLDVITGVRPCSCTDHNNVPSPTSLENGRYVCRVCKAPYENK